MPLYAYCLYNSYSDSLTCFFFQNSLTLWRLLSLHSKATTSRLQVPYMLDRHSALLVCTWFIWPRPPFNQILLVRMLTSTASSSTLLALLANLNSVTWSSELNHNFAKRVLDFVLQQNYKERTRPESAVQSPMETDNSPPITFNLPLFSMSPSLAPALAQHIVMTTSIPPVVATSPTPPQFSILVSPSALRAPLFVYQPIWLPTPPPIPLTSAQDLDPLSQGLVSPPSAITLSSS